MSAGAAGPRLAVIGGSGGLVLPGFVATGRSARPTRFGAPSAPLVHGQLGGTRVLLLARHGDPHAIAPHRVNYRANLWALRAAGATHVLALNTVGGITPDFATGVLCVPDQLIDYTWGREGSFHDGIALPLAHQEFAQPFHGGLRALLIGAAAAAGVALIPRGTYACTQGPRLETAAEIGRLERDGCDVVGMTAMPEAALAAELGLPYAALTMVVNPAAGKASEPITLEAIHAVAAACAGRMGQVVEALAAGLGATA